MIFQLSKWGTALGTRHLARIVKPELDKLFTNSNEKIVIDLSGVDILTNSFADELFGKKVLEIGFDEFRNRTTFINSNSFLNICIKKAIINRINELNTCIANS